MKTVVALQEQTQDETENPAVFLAGGISGCGDWQAEMTGLLSKTDLPLLNPSHELKIAFLLGCSSFWRVE